MRAFALFTPFDQSEAADLVLSEVFGSPQVGSLRKHLSQTGVEPATHLGGFASNLSDEQATLLMEQSLIEWVESNWTQALVSMNLSVLPAEN